jgi:quercetin dioxygenase-like cupin family protein
MRRDEALMILATAALVLAGAGSHPAGAGPAWSGRGDADAMAPAPPGRAGADATEVTRTVVLQNDHVRAVAIEYPPGARAPEHAHAVPRVVVVLAGGTLEMRDAGGQTRTVRSKEGDVHWRPPERHAIVNTGATRVRVVEIDVLGAGPEPGPDRP